MGGAKFVHPRGTIGSAPAGAIAPSYLRSAAARARGAVTCSVLAVVVAAAALSGVAATGARAQGLSDQLLGGSEQLSDDKPMLLQSDELIYDNANDRVIASGNVEIYFNNYTLLAERVIYDQGGQTLEAVGNVRIKEPSGALVNADRIRLTDDFRAGFIDTLRIVTAEDARIAAAVANREADGTTVFERGVFTPCKPCQDDPERAPLWQFKAAKIIHDEAEGNIYYEDAFLEIFGVPVAYVPYFFHADPSVKRRSGFLIPGYQSSDDLGFGVSVPYFLNIAPNMDATITPTYFSEQGVLVEGEFRHRTENGAYSVNLAGIYQDDGRETSSGEFELRNENEFRGSIITRGNFRINEFWQTGWDITAETDDTFRRFFKLDSKIVTDRVSKAFLEGQGNRSYFSATAMQFGGLLAEDDENAESRLLPQIDYNYVFDRNILGGELSFDVTASSLTREDGRDTTKAIADVKWRSQLIDRFGQVFTPFASVRGDVYGVEDFDDPDDDPAALLDIDDANGEDADASITRFTGQIGLDYSYPFVKHTATASHVFEPVGQVIVRSNDIDQSDVPNEDARSLVFDDTLLFDTDKFSGYDRVETGTRANVGLRYTIQAANGGFLRAVFGQSFHLGGENPFEVGTGLEEDRSDYVAGLYIQPSPVFTFFSQARFDQDTFEAERVDTSIAANFDGIAGGALTYAFTQDNNIDDVIDDQQEIAANAFAKITEYWSVFGAIRYDIEKDFTVQQSLGLRYSDECFVLAVSYEESNIDDREVDPDRAVKIQFELKHVGGTTFESDAINKLIAVETPEEATSG